MGGSGGSLQCSTPNECGNPGACFDNTCIAGDESAPTLAVAKGLSEQIAAVLSRIPYLRVIAPSAAPSAGVANEGYMLEGSVTSGAGTVQVTVGPRDVDGQMVGQPLSRL